MRDNWNRATVSLDLGKKELESLIQPAFGNRLVENACATEGGLSNTNIRVKIVGFPEPYLIRLYVRDSNQAKKECALNRLVEKTVPSPRLIYFSETNLVTGHPYAIMEWIDGQRLESVFLQLTEREQNEAGSSVGQVLSAIHSYQFPRAGFFDDQLAVTAPINLGSAGLIDFVADSLSGEVARDRAGEALADRLLHFINAKAALLDEWTGAPCLTHADFGGSNILLAYHSGAWKVSAVLDWEFALSGSPFFDFGNLLRNPLGSIEPFVAGLIDSYLSSGSVLPAKWRKMSLLTDLTAWVEFLTRPHINQALIEDCQQIINKTIEDWQN